MDEPGPAWAMGFPQTVQNADPSGTAAPHFVQNISSPHPLYIVKSNRAVQHTAGCARGSPRRERVAPYTPKMELISLSELESMVHSSPFLV